MGPFGVKGPSADDDDELEDLPELDLSNGPLTEDAPLTGDTNILLIL